MLGRGLQGGWGERGGWETDCRLEGLTVKMGGGTEVSSGTALLRDLSRLGIYSQGRIYDSLDAKEGQTKLESSKF